MPPQPYKQEIEVQTPRKGSKISNTEWGLVIGAAICVDVGQIILDLFGIGTIVNPVIDFIIGMTLPFYFWIRGVKPDTKRVLTWLASWGFEQIPIVDALPLWSLDVISTMLWDKVDKKVPHLPI